MRRGLGVYSVSACIISSTCFKGSCVFDVKILLSVWYTVV